MPRPRYLSEQKQSEIYRLLMHGCSLETAARHVGCTAATIRRESKRNPEFADRVRQVRCTAEMNPLRTLCDASHRDWRAAAWLLERTQPEQFAKRPAGTFSRQEVAALLERVCEVFRRETRDAEKYARIKRSVAALAKQVITASTVDVTHTPIAQLEAVDNVPTETSIQPPVSSSELPASSIQRQATGTESTPAKTPVSNAKGSTVNVVCLADIKPRHTTTYDPSATEE